MEVILWPPSLNSSVFHLLEDKVRFSVPLRIRILENNDRADRTDVIKIKKIRYALDNRKQAIFRLTLNNRLKIWSRASIRWWKWIDARSNITLTYFIAF